MNDIDKALEDVSCMTCDKPALECATFFTGLGQCLDCVRTFTNVMQKAGVTADENESKIDNSKRTG